MAVGIFDSGLAGWTPCGDAVQPQVCPHVGFRLFGDKRPIAPLRRAAMPTTFTSLTTAGSTQRAVMILRGC